MSAGISVYPEIIIPALGTLLDVKFVEKPITTARSNTTVLAADPHLSIALGPNQRWIILGHLLYNSNTTPDLKMAFDVPTGGGGTWMGIGPVTSMSGTGASVDFEKTVMGVANTNSFGTGGDVNMGILGLVATADTPGSITMHWAQNTSDAASVFLYLGSWLLGLRMV